MIDKVGRERGKDLKYNIWVSSNWLGVKLLLLLFA